MKYERIKINSHFYLDEFVDPHTYFNTDDHGLSLVDPALFDYALLLRFLYKKPLYINTWWKFLQRNKDRWPLQVIIDKIERITYIRKWSGTRNKRTPIGSTLSAHRYDVHGVCKAIDTKGDGPALFKIVEDHAEVFHNIGIRRLEDTRITKTWLHGDTLERNTKPKSIRVVNLRTASRTIYF